MPDGGKVIQLGNDGLALYKAAVVGASVEITNGYASRSGLRLIAALRAVDMDSVRAEIAKEQQSNGESSDAKN